MPVAMQARPAGHHIPVSRVAAIRLVNVALERGAVAAADRHAAIAGQLALGGDLLAGLQ